MTDKHLLVTVSDNSSLAGIHFMSSFFSDKRNLKVTLLYVAPSTSPKEPGLDDAWLSPEEKGTIKTSSKVEKTLADSRKILCKSGISDSHIDTKITAKLQTKVKDIIREGHSGKYDAVVLGRRSVSRFEKFLDESVSDELLKHNMSFPLWICRNPEIGRKNVLLCLDGSDTAYRAADHVGYMVNNQLDHKITLFHVDRGTGMDSETIFDTAGKILLDHGISKDRIATKKVKAFRVRSTILQEVEKQKYAVVAIGLLGRQLEGIKGLFISSKSTELLKKLNKVTLWGCC